MIGNDVIDLALAAKESNWQRKGFIEKLFTSDEQLLIQKATDNSIMVWSLWSQKEAVYKILRQKGASRGFYPLKIECLDGDTVQFQNQIFYTKTSIENTLLHTLAVSKKSDFEFCKPLFDYKKVVYKKEIPFYLKNGIHLFSTKSHHGQYEKCWFLSEFGTN